MHRIAFLALVLPACTGDGRYTYAGFKVYDHFPLDGSRLWTYSQDDKSVEWQRLVEKVQPTEVVGDYEIVTLEHRRDDTKDIVYSVQWSSDSVNGIHIHGFGEGAGEIEAFDPPIKFGSAQMTPEEFSETETGGATFLSTFVAQEACPNHWVPDWTCLHFHLEGAGLPFEGDYWIAPRYGASLFQTVEDTANWNLLNHNWTPDE